MESKTIRESAIENQVYEIFPNDLNPRGTIFGGRVLELIDMLGGIAARRHSEKVCVTASMDSIDFVAPAKTGDILILKAAVNNAWNTSCEVGVKVFVEDPKTRARKHLASAYLTFVALNDAGNPAPVPKIIPRTKQEKRRFQEAEERRKIRLERKEKKKGGAR